MEIVCIIDTLFKGTKMTSFYIFLFAGIMGGIYTTVVESIEQRDCSEERSCCVETTFAIFSKNVLMSTIAAFLVPLFLYIVDNKEIENINGVQMYSKQFYYLLGFALIAAVYAKVFIEKVSDSVLKELKNTKRATEGNTKQINELIEEKNSLEAKATESLFESKVAKAELALLWKEYERGIKEINEILNDDGYVIDDDERCRLMINMAFAQKRVQNVVSALETINKVLDTCPKNIDAIYNKICYLAILRQEDEMFPLIANLASLDNKYIQSLEEDDDFKEYKDDARFVRLKEANM